MAKHIVLMTNAREVLMYYMELRGDLMENNSYFESKFLNTNGSFAIYQLKPGEENDQIRFLSYANAENKGIQIKRELYNCVFCGDLSEVCENMLKKRTVVAGKNPRKIFNTPAVIQEIYHMTDYTRSYLSEFDTRGTYISDVIGLNIKNTIEY